MYIHNQKNWPRLTIDHTKTADLLADVRHLQGKLLGRMETLGFILQEEASLETLTHDVTKTSEIEGETLDAEQVRSSIARKLGMDIATPIPPSRDVEGIVEIMLDATQKHNKPLTKERLCNWHTALFRAGSSGMQHINVGEWRDDSAGAMQVVSGAIGKEKVHYEAPTFDRLEKEMMDFMAWYNTPSDMDLVLKSALAHFWFVTIHPFDDGNGRIARAIADMTLAQAEQSQKRFYSMSSQIQKQRKGYYDVLEQCQKGGLDITLWIIWFLECLRNTIIASDKMLAVVLTKSHFWDNHKEDLFNERQRLFINRLFDGFTGNLTSSKWAKIGKCSQDTALRDITDLIERGILQKNSAGGRSTNYALTLSSKK
ncbi:MAG: Fic family protein [Alphaproteobacteria bacterium]|nr:Fic family protein [Alphaproteobacteria bacterium]MBE8220896.1 Fic family protein [Alphaproteobacteria bacterium]